jgi:hypothetical protein
MKTFIEKTIILSAILVIAASVIYAQQTNKPLTYRSLFWMDENMGVEVYLIERHVKNDNFNLVVVSDKDIKVTYRTSINSIEPVVKELIPIKTAKGRAYYDVQHNFTKMTIWMALDFKFEGKKIDSLTRTFYDDLFSVVPDEQFLKNPPK